MKQPKERHTRCPSCKELKPDVHVVKNPRVKKVFPRLCGGCLIPVFKEHA